MFFSVYLTYGYSICNGYSVFSLTRRLAFPFLTVRCYMMMCPDGCTTIYRYDMEMWHLPTRITPSIRHFSAKRIICSAEISASLQKNSGYLTDSDASAITISTYGGTISAILERYSESNGTFIPTNCLF